MFPHVTHFFCIFHIFKLQNSQIYIICLACGMFFAFKCKFVYIKICICVCRHKSHINKRKEFFPYTIIVIEVEDK